MRPEAMPDPPAVDPREHAIQTVSWGESACHLVHHDGRYYAWVVHPGVGPPDAAVYPMPAEEAARRFLTDWKAFCLLTTAWDQRIAHVFVLDPGGSRILYEAAVIDVAGDGIWLASRDTIGAADGEDRLTAARFDDPGAAVEAFAAHTERAAGQIEGDHSVSFPELIAASLRYRAAMARGDAARAALGDAMRRDEARIRGGRSVSVVARAAGVSREFLHRVLAGGEWAWPQGRQVRPPGARLPDTAVSTLAGYSVDGQQFSLVSYRDSAGGKCVAIDRDGHPGAPLCDVEVSDRHPLGAGMTMQTMRRGTAAVYGRAHDSIASIYAVMKNGERVDWPIWDDPGNAQRYFAVIADCQSLADIVGVARTGPGSPNSRQVSLKGQFAIWFRPSPHRQ